VSCSPQITSKRGCNVRAFLRAPPFNVRKKRVTLMYELGHERHGDFVLPDRSYQN
jgi:hypothetical protein